ncbi:Excinuclease ABC C subunit domain protein [Stanieria sp. NIES-3757]|nr:Excinuclease ABC C subunit domain protein [Stanieria sp. NIES-3757]
MIADSAILQLPQVSLHTKELLPEYSGIYYVLDEKNTVWYIGKAKNLRKRWQGKSHHRIYQLQAQKKQSFTIYYESIIHSELDNIEKQRIAKYQPHLNSSPVKTKKVRPTETLLRETIVAISDFAFILGVEPPRKNIESQINLEWLKSQKILNLNIIHICLDWEIFKEKFNPESVDENEAIIKAAFNNRKIYANKWEGCPQKYPFVYRLSINGYVIEIDILNFWSLNNEVKQFQEYNQINLAQENIKVITPESLTKIKQQSDKAQGNRRLFLQRLYPYTCDLISLHFKESIYRESVKQKLIQISQDHKTGQRGVGSRYQPTDLVLTTIEELLISRGINSEKYNRSNIIGINRGNKIGLYIKCFFRENHKDIKLKFDSLGQGIINNKQVMSSSRQLNTVYLLTSIDKLAWLLVEEYLQDFAKVATGLKDLKNGEGYVEKFYVSARKYIVPAKVNIKLETIGYSAWIPFGFNEEYNTFELAKQEIIRRLKNSDLPELKLTFKRESITK